MITNFEQPLAHLCNLNYSNESNKIINRINKLTGYNIRSNNRKQEVVRGRQIAMYQIRKNTTLSLQEIGNIFNKDHATVIHALKVVQDIIDTRDKKYLYLVETIKQ